MQAFYPTCDTLLNQCPQLTYCPFLEQQMGKELAQPRHSAYMSGSHVSCFMMAKWFPFSSMMEHSFLDPSFLLHVPLSRVLFRGIFNAKPSAPLQEYMQHSFMTLLNSCAAVPRFRVVNSCEQANINLNLLLHAALFHASGEVLAPLVSSLPLELRPKMEAFLSNCLAVFDYLDCTLLEMNPFTLDPASGQPFPLDIRVELDDTAAFRNGPKWGDDLEFPLPFGRTLTDAESYVHTLDEATGASLKFTVLNPKGRVWLMVAGGGASVIYTDTVGDLGYAQELGNYGEYSGAPNTAETYAYAKTVIECATANPDGRGRALLIGGGIANFTDVAATFKGITQALREQQAALQRANMHIYVRRGGPNYQTGLAAMKTLGAELGVPVEVYGPEASMTGICKKAIDFVRSFDK
jgi:hypothetical protein